MEKIDLGNYKIATNWDEVTLNMWCDYLRKVADSEDKKTVDIISLLECFSNIPRNVIYQIPSDLFGKILNKMNFLNKSPKNESSNKIEINKEIYSINIEDKLTVKEYLDLQTIIENDKFNYQYILALLCRKQDEKYNEKFISDNMEQRAKMFEEQPIIKILPLINFFLTCWKTSNIRSLNYLAKQEIIKEATEFVKNIKLSHPRTAFTFLLHPRQILNFYKLKKSLKKI